jgi:hypothetical protein
VKENNPMAKDPTPESPQEAFEELVMIASLGRCKKGSSQYNDLRRFFYAGAIWLGNVLRETLPDNPDKLAKIFNSLSDFYHEAQTEAGIIASIAKAGGSSVYPREDKCRFCGGHIGWILDPVGEVVALGVCDKPECKEKAEDESNKRT